MPAKRKDLEHLTHKQKKVQWLQDWREKNRQRVKLHNAKQRAKMPILERRWRSRMAKKAVKAAWDGVFTRYDWAETVRDFNYSCAYCGATPRKLHLEHFMPIGSGGKHTKDNCIPACATCNDDKHDMTPLIWLLDRLENAEPSF